MRFEDLSPEDQALVRTDFGGLDKVAAEQVKTASEMYNAGADMALATADQMDKIAAEEKDEEEKEECSEEEKKASEDFGNIIAEGFTDKLAELGEDRYGNPAHYLMPYIEEKIAQAGAHAALVKSAGARESFMAAMGKGKSMAGAAANTAKGVASKGAEKATNFAKATGKDAKDMVAKGKTMKERASSAARPAGVAAGAAGASYATSKLLSKKKED